MRTCNLVGPQYWLTETAILHTISSGTGPLSFLSSLSRDVGISSINSHTSFCIIVDIIKFYFPSHMHNVMRSHLCHGLTTIIRNPKLQKSRKISQTPISYYWPVVISKYNGESANPGTSSQSEGNSSQWLVCRGTPTNTYHLTIIKNFCGLYNSNTVAYSQKMWQEITSGSLAVCLPIAKSNLLQTMLCVLNCLITIMSCKLVIQCMGSINDRTSFRLRRVHIMQYIFKGGSIFTELAYVPNSRAIILNYVRTLVVSHHMKTH